MQIVYKKVNELIPYINNSRTHSEEQVNQIVASINEFGFTNPLLIDEKDNIIAGHGRLLASKKLKMEEVPCIVLKGLTEAQKKAYIIADNKMALNAGWDFNLLSLELENLKELDFDLELTGFSTDEIDGLLSTNEDIENNDYEEQDLKENNTQLHKCPECGCEFED
ncbi:MAG: ParB/Srx family N-terminal domain-containing protein [Clostridiales bacterium]|uniref:ParB/Srx family N-terminal domain-containing protein n=1 Tax=Terrisporobacter sp. TaxID=1965305 RepID=UPI002A593D18|nr:ParB/Srx family N-terminal domain-containing protein [Terrisporobacter sp.]MDD7756100.1 ParB/Srx family N-terminal domain-containing protein [Clostridiales bacterium]MDY4136174.1 ParB/Srx family N-terminal domain-containing protein [Terrisporobacter sp.]